MRRRASALHAACFVAGWLGVVLGLRCGQRVPFVSWIGEKAAWLLDHAADHDLVVVGSSRLHFGFVPAVFDARIRELGGSAHAFNLAHTGLRSPDVEVLVDWLCAVRPAGLRSLWLEVDGFEPVERDGELWTDQAIDLHPPTHWLRRVEAALAESPDAGSAFRAIGLATLHTLLHVGCVGQGRALLEGWLGLRRVPPCEHAGHVAVEDRATAPHRGIHERWLAEPQAFEQLLLERRFLPDPPGSAFERRAWRRLVEAVQRVGWEPVLVLPPNLGRNVGARQAVLDLGDCAVLELDRVDVWPLLRDRGSWYDAAHLSAAGARQWSRDAADALLAQRRGERLPPRAGRPAPASLDAAYLASGDALEIVVDGLQEGGDVLVLVSTQAADTELGTGMRRGVGLPALAQTMLPRAGAVARGVCPLPSALGRAALHVQAGVWRHGVLVEVSTTAVVGNSPRGENK